MYFHYGYHNGINNKCVIVLYDKMTWETCNTMYKNQMYHIHKPQQHYDC